MKFRKIRKALFRARLEISGFYDGVTFQGKNVEKKVKKVLAEWMFCLKEYKEIRVECFKDLFSKLHEVAFPIKIEEGYGSSLNIIIIDNKGTEYYMIKRGIYVYNDMESYIIGRRNGLLEPLVDRDFHYKISKDGTITLIETGAMKLKEDVTNDDIVVDFCFDSKEHTTEATLKSYASNSKIKMKYTTMDDEFDKKVQEYLFNVNERSYYYYDVFPILKWMLLILPSQNVSLSISLEVDSEICSKVDIVQGIVQKYTKTEIINEGERRTSIDVFAKRIEDFLAERS